MRTGRPLDARLAAGATVGVLLVGVPLAVLAVLVATGHTGDRGGLVLLVLLAAVGGYVLLDVAAQARTPAAPREIVVSDPTGLYGVTVPAPEPTGSAPRPWRAVVTVLALIVVGPFAIAIPMSILDGHLRDRPFLAWLVVTVLVGVAVVVVGWLVRRVTTRRG